MRRRWRRLGLPLIAAALFVVLNLTPALAQGAYPGNGYMAGSGGMSYQAPAQAGGSGYRAGPSYRPPIIVHPRSPSQRDAYAFHGDADHTGATLYVVRLGDTLTRIARRFGTSVAAIVRANPVIFNPDLIFAGQTLVIPLGHTMPTYGAGAAAAGGYRSPAPQGSYAKAMPPMMMPGGQAPAAPPVMPAPGSQTVAVNLTAQNLAFNLSAITVPVGAQVMVNFDNQDAGVPHNFAVYTDSSAQQAIFRGQIVTGPSRMTYAFMAPSQPGTYFFRCDVHFTMMTGQFVVQ